MARHVSIAEASRILNRSERTVARWLATGKLGKVLSGGHVLVEVPDADTDDRHVTGVTVKTTDTAQNPRFWRHDIATVMSDVRVMAERAEDRSVRAENRTVRTVRTAVVAVSVLAIASIAWSAFIGVKHHDAVVAHVVQLADLNQSHAGVVGRLTAQRDETVESLAETTERLEASTQRAMTAESLASEVEANRVEEVQSLEAKVAATTKLAREYQLAFKNEVAGQRRTELVLRTVNLMNDIGGRWSKLWSFDWVMPPVKVPDADQVADVGG